MSFCSFSTILMIALAGNEETAPEMPPGEMERDGII